MALSRAPKLPMPVPALAVQEDWEFDLRERERINKTSMRMYREAGTTLCGLAFLFGLRQEATLKAIKKTNCLMLPRDEWVALATEFPGEVCVLVNLRPINSEQHDSLNCNCFASSSHFAPHSQIS